VAGSGAFANGVVVGLGSRSASTKEDIEVEASAALDDHGRAWRWSAMVKQAADGGERSRAEKEAKREWRTLPCAHAQGDKATTTRGLDTIGGDRPCGGRGWDQASVAPVEARFGPWPVGLAR
jgi:hypothetical protein